MTPTLPKCPATQPEPADEGVVQPDASAAPPDATALMETLFREHNQGLVRFLAARLSSDQEAREVAQEAYVRLLQLDQPQAVGFLRAFLFKTAANIAVDRLRRRRMARAAGPGDLFDFQIERRSPEAHLAGAQDVRIVAQCLAELEPRSRRAVLLSRVHGMTHAEIAADLAVTTRTVRTYLADALVFIQQRLDAAHAVAIERDAGVPALTSARGPGADIARGPGTDKEEKDE